MYSRTATAAVVVERGQIDDRCLVDVFEPPLSVETPIDQDQWTTGNMIYSVSQKRKSRATFKGSSRPPQWRRRMRRS